MKPYVPRRVIAGFVLTAIILGGAGVLLYRVGMQFRETRENVERADQVLSALDVLSGEVEDSQAAVRVYVLTGKADYLAPFNRGLAGYKASIDQLSALTADKPGEQARLVEMQPHVEAGFRTLQHLVELRKNGGVQAVLQDVNPEANRKELATIRGAISAMRDEENGLLNQRRQKYDVNIQRTSELFTGGIVTQCVLLLLICVVFVRDATHRAKAAQEIAKTNVRLAAILATTGDGIYQLDQDACLVYLNPAGEKLLGYALGEIVGRNMHELVHEAKSKNELSTAEDPLLAVIRGGETHISSEDSYRRQDGSFITVECTGTPLQTDDAVTGAVFSFHDITERKKAESALRASEAKLRSALQREQNVARIDFLTAILNRRGFYEIASTEAQRSRRYKRPLSLVYVDLDNFKAVNDSMGHETGDEVLVRVATSIQSAVRGTDVVARLGGDEFSILLPETDHDQAMVVVEKVRKHLLAAMRERSWAITFSVGVTSFRTVPESVDEIIREADKAMYSVKLKGKDSVAAHAVG